MYDSSLFCKVCLKCKKAQKIPAHHCFVLLFYMFWPQMLFLTPVCKHICGPNGVIRLKKEFRKRQCRAFFHLFVQIIVAKKPPDDFFISRLTLTHNNLLKCTEAKQFKLEVHMYQPGEDCVWSLAGINLWSLSAGWGVSSSRSRVDSKRVSRVQRDPAAAQCWHLWQVPACCFHQAQAVIWAGH